MKIKFKYTLFILIVLNVILISFFVFKQNKIFQRNKIRDMYRNLLFRDFDMFKKSLNKNPELFNLKGYDMYYDMIEYCIMKKSSKRFKWLLDNGFVKKNKQQRYLNLTIILKRKKMTKEFILRNVKKTVLYEITNDNFIFLEQWIKERQKNNYNIHEYTLYKVAIMYNRLKCVSLILPLFEKNSAYYLYSKALSNNNLDAIKMIHKKGFDINACSEFKNMLNVLNCAYSKRVDKTIIDYLKKHGAVENEDTKKYQKNVENSQNNIKILEGLSQE